MGYLAVLYFLTFQILGGLILLSLFIGVVTTAMDEAEKKGERVREIVQKVTFTKKKKTVFSILLTSLGPFFVVLITCAHYSRPLLCLCHLVFLAKLEEELNLQVEAMKAELGLGQVRKRAVTMEGKKEKSYSV